MAYAEEQILTTLRIGKMANALVDPRLMPGNLRYLKRTPIVNTFDSEIIARVLNQVLTADIIADDQASHVYSGQKVKFELNRVPKIKVGYAMTETMIQLWNQIKMQAAPDPASVSMFTDYQRNAVANVILGVQQRMEALIVAMHIDQVSPAYNRLGIQFGSDVSWGMWPDLKGVSAYGWADTVNSTPVNDLLGLKLIGATRYGKDYDRVTLSTALFRAMLATQEFQSKAKLYVPAQLAAGTYSSYFPLANLTQQQQFAQNVLGMDIDLYDTRHPQPQTNGSPAVYTPYLPLNVAELSQKSDDNNANVMDWGNTMPVETQMGQVPGIIGGGFPTPQYGPVAYAALANPQLDPPGYVTYGVARGFPRKYDQAATAVMSCGTIPDILAPTLAF